MNDTIRYLVSQDRNFKEARLSSLYADFNRLRNINPDGYTANVLTWQDGLCKAVEAGAIPGQIDRTILHAGPDLLRALETDKFGSPSALSSVIGDALEKGKFVPLESYLSSSGDTQGTTWITRSTHAVEWGLKRLGLVSKRHPELGHESYVIISLLEKFGDRILEGLKWRNSLTERILTRQQFSREVSRILGGNFEPSKTDAECLLSFLSGDKRTIVYDDEVVKVCKPMNSDLHITPTDKHVSSVKCLQDTLADQIDMLNKGVDESSEAARDAVNKRNRPVARRHLRSKRLQEQMLLDRSKMVAQVEEALSKIDDTERQVEFVKAMAQTTSILQSLNREVGDVEGVANIIDGLREEMNKVEEISVLLEDQTGNSLIDESEIDQEAAALEADVTARSNLEGKEADPRLGKIPSIPPKVYGTTGESSNLPATEPSRMENTAKAFQEMSLG